MRTLAPIMIVLCIGVAATMVGMAGFADAWGSPDVETTAAEEELDQNADSVAPQEGSAEGPVSSGESSIVGIIVDGSRSLVGIAAAVALLPATLMNLGFPAWFALPLGSIAYLVAGVGVIEFATNRNWS